MQSSGFAARFVLLTGSCLVLLGILANPWLVGWVLSPDGRIESMGFAAPILLFEAVCITLGTVMIRGRFRTKRQKWAVPFGLVCGSLMFSVGSRMSLR